MKVPTIHLNGTSKEELLRQLKDAHDALVNAIDVIHSIAPNGRDYYVQEEGAFEEARKEYKSRLERILSVKDEIDQIYINIISNTE